MENIQKDERILEGHTDMEKGAYLGAIASIASADRSASPEEIEFISGLCDHAGLSERQKAAVVEAANDPSGQDLEKCLEVLKGSDLKYSLITDLMAFAKADGDYSEEEQQNIAKIAEHLGVNQQQKSLLDEFSDKAASQEVAEPQTSPQGFLGLGDKMQSAGINGGGLLKGLLGMAAPLIIGSMVSRGLNRSGGLGGGLTGGGGGGLGSLIGMLSGGRNMGSTGGLLGRILGGGGF
jgi:uncharacterized tellurite resistance protein B-like protein